MRWLAMETTSQRLSLACFEDGTPRSVRETVDEHKRVQHSENLVREIGELLKVPGWEFRDLGLLAVGLGPGSFTGIRLGLGFAKGAALGSGLKLVGVPTLEAWAYAAGDGARGRVAIWLDARRGLVYHAHFLFKDGAWEETLPAAMVSEQEARQALAAAGGIALAADREYEGLPQGAGVLSLRKMKPLAEGVGLAAWKRWQAGQVIEPALLEPMYLRRAEAEVAFDKRHGDKRPSA